MKKTVLVVSLIMILTLGLVGCGEDKTESSAVATDGSTSMEKVIGTLGESFQKENEGIKFSYNATGSSSGISAVLEDRCDIGLSSRVLSDDEKAKGLKETVLAYDGIAIVVNPNNSVQDLTLEQISKIYTGEINNWNQLGGDDKEIVVIGREAGSGTRDGFESITETEDKCAYRQELTSTGDVLTTVSKNENAIGYASLASISKEVKTVKINGVEPTEKTVKDKSYAIQRPFMLITKTDKKLSNAAQKFFDFAISKDAVEMIEAAGVVSAL